MRVGDVVIPRLGKAWLCLDHDNGVTTKIFSNLTAPTRERSITLELECGTIVGHYSISQDDDTAQLSIRAGGRDQRAVFSDDALTRFLVRTYERCAAPRQDGDELALDAEVVALLARAKRLCERQWSLLSMFWQRPPLRSGAGHHRDGWPSQPLATWEERGGRVG